MEAPQPANAGVNEAKNRAAIIFLGCFIVELQGWVARNRLVQCAKQYLGLVEVRFLKELNRPGGYFSFRGTQVLGLTADSARFFSLGTIKFLRHGACLPD